MPLFACGINHKTTPIALREKVYFAANTLTEPLQDLIRLDSVNEAVILSTCNRTEVYCEAQEGSPLIQWLNQQSQVANQGPIEGVYCHQEIDAVRHIMRVACGLDSMALGEPQILGQLKSAFTTAQQAGALGPQLQRLFQYIFATTKQVRTHTGIGASSVSMAYLAVDLAKHIFADLSQTTALVVGAGDTIELALRYLRTHQVKQITVANRTYAKAALLARKYQAHAISFTELITHLPQADIIITATGASLPILGKGSFERALKLRKRRPMLIVDLAVPRDVEPEVAELSDVYLYCVDDLQKIIANNLGDRRAAADLAEKLVELQADHFIRWLRSLDSVVTIRDYRSQIERFRDDEINKAQRMLTLGHEPNEVIAELARSFSNRIMHAPTIQMRQAGYEGQLEMLALARQLFSLDSSG